jgi:hypothetical protein
MKKLLLLIAAITIATSVSAQVPYFAGTAGDANLYGYTSLKVRPGINYQETYTTFQYGIGNRFATGLDLYTGPGSSYIGYLVRANAVTNKWFNLGFQATPSFNLNGSHKFSYFTGAIYMNGSITNDGNLFWVSNTWWGVNNGSRNSIDQWWYLGYYFDFKDKGGITPMAGVLHDWRFENQASIAVGAYYTYKKFNFYLWSDKLNQKNPRIIIGVDFKFNCK